MHRPDNRLNTHFTACDDKSHPTAKATATSLSPALQPQLDIAHMTTATATMTATTTSPTYTYTPIPPSPQADAAAFADFGREVHGFDASSVSQEQYDEIIESLYKVGLSSASSLPSPAPAPTSAGHRSAGHGTR